MDATDPRIQYNADIATCCLTMVPIVVKMPGRSAFTVYSMPWNCLDTCKNMSETGADWVTVCPGAVAASMFWIWDRPTPAKHARAVAA